MLDKDQFSQLTHDVLIYIGASLYSPAAVYLLLGTAAQESRFGTYIKQIKGPALGVFQMEPDTEEDIWINFLRYQPYLKEMVKKVTGVKQPDQFHLRGNLLYQIAMARLHYWRKPEPLPSKTDITGMAKYWKKHYNTYKGKGTVEEFQKNYTKYVL